MKELATPEPGPGEVRHRLKWADQGSKRLPARPWHAPRARLDGGTRSRRSLGLGSWPCWSTATFIRLDQAVEHFACALQTVSGEIRTSLSLGR
jgi:hypothetical protein